MFSSCRFEAWCTWLSTRSVLKDGCLNFHIQQKAGYYYFCIWRGSKLVSFIARAALQPPLNNSNHPTSPPTLPSPRIIILSNNKRFCQRLSNVSCSSGGTIKFLIEPRWGAEIQSGVQVPHHVPPLSIRPKKIAQIWSRYYRGQAISNKAVTLRATLGDRNQWWERDH